MSERVVDWLDLPRELLMIISKSLDPRVDVPRFRSVCTLWRSSIPPTHALSPRFPIKFPHPDTAFGSTIAIQSPGHLYESTLYLLKPLNPFPTSNSSLNKGWLIKVEDSSSGGLHLAEPLSYVVFKYELKSKILNLLNFRVMEVGKMYHLEFGGYYPDSNYRSPNFCVPHRYTYDFCSTKVVMSHSSTSTNAFESAAFLMLQFGRLAFARYGDEMWTSIDDRDLEHMDIIVYKGQFYVIDKYGKLSQIESSSLKLVQFSPPFSNVLGDRKHLVESCESLYVVDRLRTRMEKLDHKTIDVKVYKLDEEIGQWVLIKSLGDRAFFLGCYHSFSISAPELVGCKENCIYFRDGMEFGAFEMEDHSIQEFCTSTNNFLPCCITPTWFSSIDP